jgi:DNA-binding transcriptional LysR family regulator
MIAASNAAGFMASLDLFDVALFVRAASLHSLSRAARALGLTPGAASRRLDGLERHLGTRLMNRSTHGLQLTAEGQVFLERARGLLAAVEEAEGSVGPRRQEATGLLRVTAPPTFGRKVIAPILPGLMSKHPDLRIDLALSDSIVDIVESGIDVAIRLAPLASSSLIARKIANDRRIVCAAPAYLKRRGAPKTPTDLARHNCLVLPGMESWRFVAKGRTQRVRVGGTLTSNNNELLREATLSGIGIGLHSLWDIADELRRGELVALLGRHGEPEPRLIAALYPSAKFHPPRLQVFLQALQDHIGKVPFWERAVG